MLFEGEKFFKGLLSELIIKVLMEFSINSSRGKILIFRHIICAN